MSRVLIIDDDPIFGERAASCLQHAGLHARFHKGPFGSLHSIRETGCDIVLVDVDMPRLDGGLLVKMIREAYGLGRTRIMLVGDKEDDELRELAAIVGAHGYVSKHASSAMIVERVLGLGAHRAARHSTEMV
jgi:two-component system chemotaxis response regulator CheY